MARSKLKPGTPPIPMTLPTIVYQALCEFSIRPLAVDHVQTLLHYNISTIVDHCVKQGWLELEDQKSVQVVGSPRYKLCDGVDELLEPLAIERSRPRVYYDHQGLTADGLPKSARATVFVFDHSNFVSIAVYLPREDIKGGKIVWSGSEVNWPSCGAQKPALARLFKNAMDLALQIATEADRQYPIGQAVDT